MEPVIPSLEIERPTEVLLWMLDNITNPVLVTSLGRQTVIIIDMLHKMGKAIPTYMIDTDLLFEETYNLKKEIENKYSIEVNTIKTDITIEDQGVLYGPNLWNRDPDLCCNIRKVKPLESFLKDYDAWITGIRRDQSRSREEVKTIEFDKSNQMLKINPLAYWTYNKVSEYIADNNIPENKLYKSGYKSIGCIPCTSKPTCGGERDGRWNGIEKTECGIHKFKK